MRRTAAIDECMGGDSVLHVAPTVLAARVLRITESSAERNHYKPLLADNI